MILSGRSIEEAILQGRIGIDHFQKTNLKGASYTFTLGSTLLIPNKIEEANTEAPTPTERHEMGSDGFTLEPNQFILGTTQEKLTLHGTYACFLSARGSCAQIGLHILLSSTFAEPDTDSLLILEIHNANQNPIRLQAGMKIVKGIFTRIE